MELNRAAKQNLERIVARVHEIVRKNNLSTKQKKVKNKKKNLAYSPARDTLPCKLSSSISVKAIYKQCCSCPTRVCKLVINYHHLQTFKTSTIRARTIQKLYHDHRRSIHLGRNYTIYHFDAYLINNRVL